MRRLKIKRIIIVILIIIFLINLGILIFREKKIENQTNLEDLIFKKHENTYLKKIKIDNFLLNENYKFAILCQNCTIKNKDLLIKKIYENLLEFEVEDIDYIKLHEKIYMISLITKKYIDKKNSEDILKFYVKKLKTPLESYNWFSPNSIDIDNIKRYRGLLKLNSIIEICSQIDINNFYEFKEKFSKYNITNLLKKDYCTSKLTINYFNNNIYDYLYIKYLKFCEIPINSDYLNQIKIYEKEKNLKEQIKLLI